MKYWRLIYLSIPLTVAVFAAILLVNEWKGARPAQGVGQVPETVRYADGAEAVEEESAEYRLDSYVEGDGLAPEWWDPGEPMAVEWTDNARQSESNPMQRTDAVCPDWNVDSTLYGWDGHTAEAWELDLYARIVYLEFWGCSPECCEAGADSILRLWESGYFGPRLSDTLTATAEDGSLVYSPYAYVWDWDYDPNGLAEMRELCESRFYSGPVWIAPYFRLWYYHPWAVPAYEIDGVYFSVGRVQ